MVHMFLTCFLGVAPDNPQQAKELFVDCLAHIKRTLNPITAKGEFDY